MIKALVTGGSGFVGFNLAKKLKEMGFYVITISRTVPQKLIELGVECRNVDISSEVELFEDYFHDVEVIFHTAAKVDTWGEYKDFYNINVAGTENILKIATKLKIPYLVYTSSPSVISSEHDLLGVNESIEYPKKYLALYPMTKAIAEKLVLNYAKHSTVKCLSLRPHLIFGKNDNHLIPMIQDKAKKGKLYQIGNGQNVADVTYIDDCVDAHILAYQALKSNPTICNGKSYFISQNEPVKLWEWINNILELSHLNSVSKKLPESLALKIAWFNEQLANLNIINKPQITRFIVKQMSKSHYFSINNAIKDLKYNPKFTVEDALKNTFS